MSTIRIRRFLLLIAVFVGTATAADSHSKLEPVPPGRLYKGHYVDIRAPESQGWYLAGSSGISMAFERKGTKQDERYGAEVFIFPLPPAKTRAEFIRLIKERFRAHAKRFGILKSDYSYTDKRNYPCVHISAVVERENSSTGADRQHTPVVQFISLYCRLPVRPKTGFAIVFSHRGDSPDPNLETEAQSFADGVRVPGH